MVKPLLEAMDLKIVKANDLIRAGYRLPKREQIFVLYLIAKLDSIHQTEFTDINLSYKQVLQIFNFDGKRRVSKRKEVFTLLDNLNNAPIYLEDYQEKVHVNRISSITHNKTTDVFTFRVDPALKPFLLKLHSFFTEYYFKFIIQLNLSASFRLYELFKSYHSKNKLIEKIYEIEDLKFRLGIKGKYQKFYEFKRWILVPSLKELEQYTDIKATYSIYEKVGRAVTKIKFRIQSNPKNIKAMKSPKAFLKAINQTEQSSIDLSDPIFSSEVFQLFAPYEIKPTDEVKEVIQKCSESKIYKNYVIDTVNRCKKDFERNPKIDNQGGYILSAINENYHKHKRSKEQEQVQKELAEKTAKQEKEKIHQLVQEGKASFYTWRKPFITKLRDKHLTDALIENAIKANARDAFYRKAMELYKTGKASKMIDKWVDDYVASEYLAPEFSNIDSYLEKNFGLKKIDSEYILSA